VLGYDNDKVLPSHELPLTLPSYEEKPHVYVQMGSTMITWLMCECHQLTKQCQFINEKIKEKATKECEFAPAKHETLHLSQWTQKYSKQYHDMQSSPHHGCNKGGGSPWGLTSGHECNVSN